MRLASNGLWPTDRDRPLPGAIEGPRSAGPGITDVRVGLSGGVAGAFPVTPPGTPVGPAS